MLNIYICEDDDNQRENISKFIHNYLIFKEIDSNLLLSTNNPEEVIHMYNQNNLNYALFFLDINLNSSMNGIELASEIKKINRSKTFIVFLTSHSEMTFLTFRYKTEALDFIVKDKIDNIKQSVLECIDIAYEKSIDINNDYDKKIQIDIDQRSVFLNFDEILYFESGRIKRKIKVYTMNRGLEFNSSMKSILAKLDKRFVRCHTSFIVNTDKITEINKNDNTIRMINGDICFFSRDGRKKLEAIKK
ncbi:MAG: LytTR family DNA-binding domain-containing protein [Defluviitaleaceae bacterium]|nr:LytTR family DNA-binding domain-containing protein [Defluviitaleaceae bacterium]